MRISLLCLPFVRCRCYVRCSFLRCCGASEFIKLHAYTLTEYHRVVHLDVDTLLLHPLDRLMGEQEALFYLFFEHNEYTIEIFRFESTMEERAGVFSR